MGSKRCVSATASGGLMRFAGSWSRRTHGHCWSTDRRPGIWGRRAWVFTPAAVSQGFLPVAQNDGQKVFWGFALNEIVNNRLKTAKIV